jgi:hypothetical protein
MKVTILGYAREVRGDPDDLLARDLGTFGDWPTRKAVRFVTR